MIQPPSPTETGNVAAWPRRYWPFGLALAAALLLAPSLVLGTLNSHSSPQNLTWAAQFTDQFRAGVVYPRWLPDSFDRLGGPAFYFYPPLAFWVDALLSVATFDVFSVSYRLSLSSLLLLWASGISMHAWLKAEATSPRAAIVGALAYVAAPYHLLDHYYRGAYAEFAAYVVLPLVALSIRQIAERRRFGPVLLAGAYAALPMAHLPTALLISLTAIPMYVLYRGWRLGSAKAAAGFFIRCALGGALGLGLAAIYLVPALALQDWIPAETFWVSGYRIENWFLLTPERWLHPIDMMLIIASFAAAYAIATLGVVATLVRGGGQQGWRSDAAFWAFVCLVCVLLIAGALPWFWRLPFVAKVQFPWRLMIVVEFAAITALCLVRWPARSRVRLYAFIAAFVAFVPGAVVMVAGIGLRVQVALVQPDVPADLKQFLPAGYPQKPNGGYAELSLEPLASVPMIACAPEPRICRATGERFGELRIEVDADVPTVVVLRRFFFPFWRLDPALPVAAIDPLRLVSFAAPPGRHSYRLSRRAVAEEKAGWAISGLSLALMLAWAAAAWRGIRPV
ncbi:MAG: hypothetical protein ACHQK9_11490 [Reyranellales bacterium]